MKHKLLALFLTLSCVMMSAAEAVDTLAYFGLNSFEGWTYSRSDIELSRDNISRLRIRLYKNQGVDYTLTSPVVDCTGCDSLVVRVGYVTDITGYTVSKLSLTFTVKNGSDEVVAQATVAAQKDVVEQMVEARMCLPMGISAVNVNVAALSADINNNGAVRSILIYSPTHVTGDVNGDDKVDIADINCIIDLILASEFAPNGDVNGDGKVDIADINVIIDMILTH